MRLDLGQFHPLDHSLAQCSGYPGGRWRHIKYKWQWQWRERLRLRLLHLIGRHDWACMVRIVDKQPVYRVVCRGCDAEPSQFIIAALIGNTMHSREAQLAIGVISQLATPDDTEEQR